MIARFFQWAFKAGTYMAIGAAAAIYGPQYASHEGVVEIRQKAEAFIDQRVEKPIVEVDVLPPAIRVVTATQQELVEKITTTGTIHARDIALVGADVSGLKVLELLVDVGDVVQKGAVLATLDQSNLLLQLTQLDAQNAQIDANLAQAKAQVADASVGVKQANEQLQRTKKLVAQRVASQAQMDNIQNAYDSAIARENSAKQAINVVDSQRAVLEAQRRQIELQIEKTQILAPVSGVILSKNASIGAVVSGASGPLFQIAEDAAFELAAEVPESVLSTVQEGMKAEVAIGAAAPMQAIVSKIEPTVSERSRLGTVNILLPQSANARAGSFASAEIETVRRMAIAVPSGAILYNGEQPFLQVVTDGTVESRNIQTGIRTNGLVEVIDGLSANETIVATAGTFVSNGDKVRPIPTETQTSGVQ